jgi:hypothetical protein
MRRPALLLVSCALVLGACTGSTATPTPSPTPVVTPTPQITDDPNATPLPWAEFTPPDKSFTVSFPGTPTTATTKTPSSTLGDVTVNAYVLVGKGTETSYLVMQERFAAGTLVNMSATDLGSILDQVMSGYATTTQGTLSNQSSGSFLGHSARTATVTSGDKLQAVMTFSNADDIYTLAAIYSSAKLSTTSKFVESFKLP